MNKEEAAKYLGCSVRAIERYASAGRLSGRYERDKTAGLRAAAAIVAFIYFVGFIGLALAPETKGKPLPQ